MPKYLYAFFMAAALSYIFTPFAMKLAWKLGAIDVPKDTRRVHKKPIPRLGGLAIFAGFTLAAFLTLPLKNPSVMGILIGSSVIVAVGILDDIYCLSPKVKLLLQIVAALIPVAFGIRVEWVTNPFGGMLYIGKYSIIITLFWIVGITNTLNFIDGLDGLAAGISAIASITMLLVNLNLKQGNPVIFTALLAGACIGFLPFNFNPAKIFMGDTGAMFLGFVLSSVAVDAAVKSATVVALIVPMLALGLPIFDTAFAIVRRFMNGKPIMQADRGHIHHRLIDNGLSQKQAVIFLYAMSLVLGLCAVLMVKIGMKEALLALTIGLFTFSYTGKMLLNSQSKKSEGM
ncbi:glycosyltransferase family 4 protein [Thermovenabulum sp.]|uniref:glycosyltransferase family 4 protein n=1 Tax=Thermovenabulum sp. TaxID=3100335 RepID=UPI003C7E283C